MNQHIPPKALNPRLVGVVSEFQWMLYRLFTVTSAVKAPGLPIEEDGWDWHRPWFCSYLHQGSHRGHEIARLAPIHAECEAARAALCRRRRRGAVAGRCAAGLKLLAWPLRDGGGPFGHLVVGPYATRPLTDREVAAVAARTAHPEPDQLHWAAQQVPVLERKRERAMIRWIESSLPLVLERYAALRHGRSWAEVTGTEWPPLYPPIRIGDDVPVALYGVFARPFEGTPPIPPPEARHNYWAMVYLEVGHLTLDTGSGAAPIVPGQFCLVRPGQPAVPVASGDPRPAGVLFTFIGQLGWFTELAGRVFTLDAHQRALLRRSCRILVMNDWESYGSMARVDLLTLLLGLKTGAPPLEPAPVQTQELLERRQALVAKARAYLAERVTATVSLKELAGHCGASISVLEEVFKQVVGIPPIRYHARLKIREAKRLLEEGGASVSEIAERLAYADTAHFSRTFKQSEGMTPSAFARTIRPEAPSRRV